MGQVTSAALSRYDAEQLRSFGARVFEHVGMRPEDAGLLAGNLVDSELRGVDTHGLARLAPYAGQLRSGDVNPRPQVALEVRTPVVAAVEGDGGFGVIAGMKAVSWATEAARSFGLAMAGVRNVGHFGTASYYTRAAAAEGFIGIAMTDTSPVVAPAGGAEPRLGNNPLSIAVPDGRGGASFCLDIAMSVVSRGRVKMHALAGRALPPHWAIDADGVATSDAEAALTGALLPFGDYKGSGLSMAIEILAGALTGAPLTQHIRHGGFTSAAGAAGAAGHAGGSRDAVTVGNLYLVIDPSVFRPAGEVLADVAAIRRYVKAVRPRPGETVLISGEPEEAAAAERTANGIPLGDATLASLRQLAAETGVDLPASRPQ